MIFLKYFDGSSLSTGSSLNLLTSFIIYSLHYTSVLRFWPHVPSPFLTAPFKIALLSHTPCSFTSPSCDFYPECSLLTLSAFKIWLKYYFLWILPWFLSTEVSFFLLSNSIASRLWGGTGQGLYLIWGGILVHKNSTYHIDVTHYLLSN